jgi:hypothetical protein
LRRQSLIAGGYAGLDRQESYRVDAFALPPDSQEAFELRMMQGQAERFSSAAWARDPWTALVGEFPQLVDARDALHEFGHPAGQIEEMLAEMYLRHAAEWRTVDSPLVGRYMGELGVVA